MTDDGPKALLVDERDQPMMVLTFADADAYRCWLESVGASFKSVGASPATYRRANRFTDPGAITPCAL